MYLLFDVTRPASVKHTSFARNRGLARPGPFSPTGLRSRVPFRRHRPSRDRRSGLGGVGRAGRPAAERASYSHMRHTRSTPAPRRLVLCCWQGACFFINIDFYLGIFVEKKSFFRFSSSRGRRFLEDFRRNLQNELLSGPIFSWTAGLRRRPLKLARHAHRRRMPSHQRPRPHGRFGGVCTPAADAAVHNA